MTRLQVRYADGELERLGIVNLEKVEQSKLYVCHIDKDREQGEVQRLFSQFGEIEELYMFKDGEEQFKGSCFIKYQTRKEALKAIKRLNQRAEGSEELKGFPAFVERGGSLEVRFADKKRKENIPLSMIPPSLLASSIAQTTVGAQA